MRHPTSPNHPPRWTRSQLYPLAGLGFAVVAGFAVLTIQAIAGGRAIYASLWLVIAALLVLGGWLFGRQEDRLRRFSVTDSLTGLANRRELEHRLRQEVARAVRHELPLSVVLLDVDWLKQINDRGGHQAGDRALMAVAEALRSTCREVDIPARVGGDEFAILAPATNARDASQLASRVQASLRAASSAAGDAVTVSIGIADIESAGGDRDLFDAADRALYQAKTRGRDRIALDGDDPPADAGAVERPAQPSLRVVPGGKA
jgi:diguanylate cyclase (GGDEF)-like protein